MIPIRITNKSKRPFTKNGFLGTAIRASLSLFAVAMIQLTDLNGRVAWINPDQVVGIIAPNGDCEKSARAQLILQNGRLCVAEDVGDAMRKLTGMDLSK